MKFRRNAAKSRERGVRITVVRWDESDIGAVYLAVRRQGTWLFEVTHVDARHGVKYRTIAGHQFPGRSSDDWEPVLYAFTHYAWQIALQRITGDVDEIAAGLADAAERDEWDRTVAHERDVFAMMLAVHVPRLLDHPMISDRRDAVKQVLADIGRRRVQADSAVQRLEQAAGEKF